MNHLVSVIIPCYNSAKFIAETLDSVLKQTYKNLEIILVNDGSSDNLEEVIKPYLSENKNIFYFKQDNKGVAAARNTGAKNAKGDYFLFLDSDDLIDPSYLEKCTEVLNNQENVKAVYSNAWIFSTLDKKNKYKKLKFPQYNFRLLLLENIIPTRALIRSTDFYEINMFDESFGFLEDWDLWINLLKNGGEAILLPETLSYYREREDNSSLTDYMTDNPDKSRKWKQKLYEKHKSYYINEFGTTIDLLDLIAEHERTITKYKKKASKWYRKLLRF